MKISILFLVFSMNIFAVDALECVPTFTRKQDGPITILSSFGSVKEYKYDAPQVTTDKNRHGTNIFTIKIKEGRAISGAHLKIEDPFIKGHIELDIRAYSTISYEHDNSSGLIFITKYYRKNVFGKKVLVSKAKSRQVFKHGRTSLRTGVTIDFFPLIKNVRQVTIDCNFIDTAD